MVLDSKGVIHPDRSDVDRLMISNPWKYRIAVETGGAGLKPGEGLDKALEGADALIAASKPGPGVVKKEWVSRMARDAIVFAEANPVPEIWPWEAREAGARIVATGRSDLPNQVNNSLIFPAVFRGVLDVRSRKITDEMTIAAAVEVARYAEEKGLREDYIIPSMEEWDLYPRVAAAVAVKAVEQGVARRTTTFEEELERARRIIAPYKANAEEYLEVHRTAHKLGIPSNATMLYGHVETLEERVEHMSKLREIQDETGGFTAFIPWTFVPGNTQMDGVKKAPPTRYLRVLSFSRVFLDNFKNIQSSHVTQTLEVGVIGLHFGANDLGSVMIEESVITSTGYRVKIPKYVSPYCYFYYHPSPIMTLLGQYKAL